MEKKLQEIERVIWLRAEQLERVRKTYHFEERDAVRLRRTAGEMSERMRAKFCCLTVDEAKQRGWDGTGYVQEVPYLLCCATLGEEIDRLSNSYMEENRLLEAYMLECLSMEMLSLLYEEGRRETEEKGYFVSSYDFFEGELLEKFARLYPSLTKYKGGFLIPQKTVIYAALFSGEKTEETVCDALCAGCKRTECIQRKN